ncbi:MAG: cyclic nucleotide-binding domain-containing protein, partial [Rhodospirillaceae bacterium]
RRAKNRPSNIKRIKVLNTMLNKTSGQEVDGDGVKDAVDGSMNEVLRARLDSHGYRLGFVCNLVIEAYEKNNITEDLKEKIEVLVDILGDAARTAERLKELDLSILCGALSKEIKKILGRYDAPTESDVALLRKASTAVVSAVKPDAPREEIEEESRQAAENYQSRERDGFEETEEIQRRPDEPLPVDFDEPVIEILPLMKGQYLFKEGDEATSAYILSSGSIAIFKEEGGKRIPIARVKKGEFFGEMAIIDSRPRRNSAMALEDCTLSLVSKDMIEEKLANSDKMIRTVLHMLTNSLKSVHDAYSPKSRSIRDSVREIRDQAQHIRTYIDTIASETVRKESAEPAKRVLELSEALIDLVESVPELDRRTPALPSEKDLKG